MNEYHKYMEAAAKLKKEMEATKKAIEEFEKAVPDATIVVNGATEEITDAVTDAIIWCDDTMALSESDFED